MTWLLEVGEQKIIFIELKVNANYRGKWKYKLVDLNKQKIYLLILLILSNAIYITSKGQLYSIESFDGGNAKIHLNYELFSKTLKVSFLKDTLFLDDYTGTFGVYVLNRTFLQINYTARGGSGVNIRNTLILTVYKNRIGASILVNSYLSTISVNKENLDSLKFNLVGNSRGSYRLIVSIHDEQKSKITPQANYNLNQQDTLKFDSSKNIFYSSAEALSKPFMVYDAKTQQTIEQHAQGTVPAIQLGKNDYYYIKGEWYQKGNGNEFIKYSHKLN
jgi:hypothetical protein